MTTPRLSGRQRAELMVPGVVIAFAAGTLAGVVAVLGGLPRGYVLGMALGLGVPLGLAGAGYEALLAAGRVRIGGAFPAAVYWLFAFPLARAVHEFSLDLATGQSLQLPHAPLSFLWYQALLSFGFTVGFIWLHEHLAPIWWVRIHEHNPRAAEYVAVKVRQAQRMQKRKVEQKERKEQKRRERREARSR